MKLLLSVKERNGSNAGGNGKREMVLQPMPAHSNHSALNRCAPPRDVPWVWDRRQCSQCQAQKHCQVPEHTAGRSHPALGCAGCSGDRHVPVWEAGKKAMAQCIPSTSCSVRQCRGL